MQPRPAGVGRCAAVLLVLVVLSSCSSSDDSIDRPGDGGPAGSLPVGAVGDELGDRSEVDVADYYEQVVGADADVAACYAEGLAAEDVFTVEDLERAEADQARAARVASILGACSPG